MLQMHIQVAMLTRQELAHIYLHKPSGEMAENFLGATQTRARVSHALSPTAPGIPSLFFVFFQCFFLRKNVTSMTAIASLRDLSTMQVAEPCSPAGM